MNKHIEQLNQIYSSLFGRYITCGQVEAVINKEIRKAQLEVFIMIEREHSFLQKQRPDLSLNQSYRLASTNIEEKIKKETT